MDEVVPGKGIILNKLSSFWFNLFKEYKSHYVSSGLDFDFSSFRNHNNIDSKILQRSTIVKNWVFLNPDGTVYMRHAGSLSEGQFNQVMTAGSGYEIK